jgi:hypothetical protein
MVNDGFSPIIIANHARRMLGDDEAFPLRDLLGVQQLGRTDRFRCRLPGCFIVGFFRRVFAEELAADRDRRLVAGRRLDALLADEALGKALHRGRWRIGGGAVAGCRTKRGKPSGGGALLELADDSQGDIAYGIDRPDLASSDRMGPAEDVEGTRASFVQSAGCWRR